MKKATDLCPGKKSPCCVPREGTLLSCKKDDVAADRVVADEEACRVWCYEELQTANGHATPCANARFDRKSAKCRPCKAAGVKAATSSAKTANGDERYVALAAAKEDDGAALGAAHVAAAAVAALFVGAGVGAFCMAKKTAAKARNDNSAEHVTAQQGGLSMTGDAKFQSADDHHVLAAAHLIAQCTRPEVQLN